MQTERKKIRPTRITGTKPVQLEQPKQPEESDQPNQPGKLDQPVEENLTRKKGE
jgi:hypothetical protein